MQTKLRVAIICIVVMTLILTNVSAAQSLVSENTNLYASESVLYVASYGDDANSGISSAEPLKNISEAYKLLADTGSIVLLDDTPYVDADKTYKVNITIKGNAGTEKLVLPEEISLKGNLKIENLTLSGKSTFYANGYTLEIAESVTSTDRLTVYGGKKNAPCGSTDIRLYGGMYNEIYGGGESGSVRRTTSVVIGGKVNLGDGIDDSADNVSPCYVYGGSNNAAVDGSTNITLCGNAVVKYLVGAGKGSAAKVVNTNINIEGGKVMNVYGGCASNGSTLENCDTHIYMTGGVAESLFGGSEAISITGNTYITVKGGEVTRRIYTGCYNAASSKIFKLEWSNTNYHVTGTTNLMVYPDAKLATGSGLSSTNGVNKGVFSGSRMKSAASDEKNTVIFIDRSYSTHNKKMGEQGVLHKSDFKSFQNYTVNAGVGGKVETTATSGKVKVTPDYGKCAIIDAAGYYAQQTVSITQNSVTTITFEGVTSANVSETENGIVVSVGVNASMSGDIIAALYDENDAFVTFDVKSFTKEVQSYDLNLGSKPSDKYSVKVFLWGSDSNFKPYTREYLVDVGK